MQTHTHHLLVTSTAAPTLTTSKAASGADACTPNSMEEPRAEAKLSMGSLVRWPDPGTTHTIWQRRHPP